MTAEKGRNYQEFNEVLIEAIDESIQEIFSPKVLETLYQVLLERYNVTRDELPYRLETAYKLLKDVFGARGVETISRSIARRLYHNLGLQLDESAALELTAYVEIAKNKLAETALTNQRTDLYTHRTAGAKRRMESQNQMNQF